MKKNIVSSILFLLGFLILFFFLRTFDLAFVKEGLSSLGIKSVLLILLLIIITIMIKALRWQYLVHKATKKEISFKFAFNSIIAGVAAGSLTPSRAGEIAKPFMLKTEYGIDISDTLSSVFIERAFDLLGLIFLFFLSLVLLPVKLGVYTIAVWGFFIIFVIILLLLFIFPKQFKKIADFFIQKFAPKNWNEKLLMINGKIFSGFAMLKKKEVLFVLFFTSTLSMFIEVVRLNFILGILGLDINFWIITFGFCASIVFGLLTLVPGGIGTTEISQAVVIDNLSSIGEINTLKWGILLDRFFSYYLLMGVGALILIGDQKWKKLLKRKN